MEQTYGIWGQRRLRYLREHHSGLLAGMQLTGQLAAHLAEVDRMAEEMLDSWQGKWLQQRASQKL